MPGDWLPIIEKQPQRCNLQRGRLFNPVAVRGDAGTGFNKIFYWLDLYPEKWLQFWIETLF